MTIRLRAHHLLCLPTWAGKGYSPAFMVGFTAITTRIAAGEAVVLVEGPDDVCTPMLDDPGCHCRGDSVVRRDARAARDVGRCWDAHGGWATAGAGSRHPRPDAPCLCGRRDPGACAGCDWFGLCRDIADDGFTATVLPAPQPDRLRA
jgi:hypothetical protein